MVSGQGKDCCVFIGTWLSASYGTFFHGRFFVVVSYTRRVLALVAPVTRRHEPAVTYGVGETVR